jgi:energy-coupling factor transporter ATP-binding protein EcfA2
MADKILKRYANESYSQKDRSLNYDDIAYIFADGQLVYLDMQRESVDIFFSEAQDEAQSLFESVKKFRRKSAALHINLIVTDHDGLSLKDLKSKRLTLQLDVNYNDDLGVLHPLLVKSLRKENANGLVLFHGDPGTGKSTYIRYLAGFLKKQIIFLSPRLAKNLDDPGFARLLMENPNSVVIIEDAEDLLISRDTTENSGISTLLNLTDGLLGTSIGIQFICTFNTPVTNIDKALLRKGRLLALYEFGPLSIEKSKALLTKLGVVDFMVAKPMTLADIYNVEKPAFKLEPKRRSIGFNACVA